MDANAKAEFTDFLFGCMFVFFLALAAIVCLGGIALIFDEVVGIDNAWRDLLALVRKVGDAWRGSP